MSPWVAGTPDAPAVRDAHLALTYAQLDAAARDAGRRGTLGGRGRLVGGGHARLSDREIDLFIDHAKPRRVIYTPHAPEAARHGADRVGRLAQDALTRLCALSAW